MKIGYKRTTFRFRVLGFEEITSLQSGDIIGYDKPSGNLWFRRNGKFLAVDEQGKAIITVGKGINIKIWINIIAAIIGKRIKLDTKHENTFLYKVE